MTTEDDSGNGLSDPPSTSLLDKWLLLGRIVADPDLPHRAVSVAYVLLDCHNGKTGRCDPSRGTISKRTGLSTRAVTTALTDLQNHKYFKRTQRGRHRSNSYAPLRPSGPDAGEQEWKESSTLKDGEDWKAASNLKPLGWKNSAIEAGSQLPPNPSREPIKKNEPVKGERTRQLRMLLPLDGKKTDGKAQEAAPSLRPAKLYRRSAGCTIDSYAPDPMTMGTWAAKNAPLVENPVAPEMVEAIKDVWRQRGEKPKDFDATYRTYLRKRQEWAAERAGRVVSVTSRRGPGGRHADGLREFVSEIKESRNA
jgi:hypothetical protein